MAPSGGTGPTAQEGTVQPATVTWSEAGLASVWPMASTERASKVWVPGETVAVKVKASLALSKEPS